MQGQALTNSSSQDILSQHSEQIKNLKNAKSNGNQRQEWRPETDLKRWCSISTDRIGT